MATSQRGIDPSIQNSWSYAIEKENKLRLKWFTNNVERLERIANKELTKAVSDEVKEEFKNDILRNYQNVQRFGRSAKQDLPVPDPGFIKCIMKPVEPAVTKLIYTGDNQEGRLNYLHERVKLLPDDRYYFPEVASFEYGWKMWDHAKNIKKLGFGRQQIVKESFYRRRGVGRDPDWYKEPAGYNPKICFS